jgi:hypothetical protein
LNNNEMKKSNDFVVQQNYSFSINRNIFLFNFKLKETRGHLRMYLRYRQHN